MEWSLYGLSAFELCTLAALGIICLLLWNLYNLISTWLAQVVSQLEGLNYQIGELQDMRYDWDVDNALMSINKIAKSVERMEERCLLRGRWARDVDSLLILRDRPLMSENEEQFEKVHYLLKEHTRLKSSDVSNLEGASKGLYCGSRARLKSLAKDLRELSCEVELVGYDPQMRTLEAT